MAGRGRGPIPAGWLHCPKAGSLLANSFVAFKTPLHSEFPLRKNHRWTTDSVFHYCKNSLKVQIGLWIDLTNTERYFNKADVEKHGAQYIKLQIGGGGEVPSSYIVQKFISACQNFLANNPDGIIGVHCTHGFNRTGFLICSFLAEVRKLSIDNVFAQFCQARPPGIYRQNYVQKLWEQFPNSDLPLVPLVDETPTWKEERDPTHRNINATPNESIKRGFDTLQSNTSYPPNKQSRTTSRFSSTEIPSPSFYASIPGIDYVQNQWLLNQVLSDVRRMCQECSGFEIGRHHHSYYDFPGQRPRELFLRDLKRLDSQYVVTPKVETAVQYLLLIKSANNVYFVDTALSVFAIKEMTFPNQKDLKDHLTDTLLDVEATMYKCEGKFVPRFFVNDIIYLCGSPVSQLNHSDRMDLINKEILAPRLSCIVDDVDVPSHESLRLTLKPYFTVEKTCQVLRGELGDFQPIGVKFLPKSDAYKMLYTGYAFEWNRNFKCIRFRIEVNRRENIANLYVLEKLEPFAWVQLNHQLLTRHGKIGQFFFDSRRNQWFFVGAAQTPLPGSYADAMAVMALKSVERIPEELLLVAIEQNTKFSRKESA